MKKTRLLEIIQEEIALALKEKTALGAGALGDKDFQKAFSKLPGDEKAKVTTGLKAGTETFVFEEDQLDEMAKITGRLEAAIKKVLSANADLDGLPLKKAIKADAEVEDALEGDTMYDNQLNKFIALVRGNREVGQRGRKADPNKVKAEPKAKAEKAKAEPKAEKASTKDMDDEDKEASKNIGSDATAKELGKTAPKDKIEKFNLGLKFIKKYKDDKPKVDAYLKKAKEEYKFSTAMLKDLKKTAGRDVSI